MDTDSKKIKGYFNYLDTLKHTSIGSPHSNYMTSRAFSKVLPDYDLCLIWVLHYNFPQNRSLGRFLGRIGQQPSASKSNRLHVVIFCFFINMRSNP
jgi:hypothetical protein